MVIGYTTGVFDMFHIGHLNILKVAKSRCDKLVVGVSTDELVQIEKNKNPVISFKDRIEIVKSISYVDEVIPQINKNKFEAWKKIGFNKMFVGTDWKGSDTWNKLESEFSKINVSIEYIEYTHSISSSKLSKILSKIK
jgi:glycerol-3-phosphate cytidylyltransferase